MSAVSAHISFWPGRGPSHACNADHSRVKLSDSRPSETEVRARSWTLGAMRNTAQLNPCSTAVAWNSRAAWLTRQPISRGRARAVARTLASSTTRMVWTSRVMDGTPHSDALRAWRPGQPCAVSGSARCQIAVGQADLVDALEHFGRELGNELHRREVRLQLGHARGTGDDGAHARV